MLGMLQHILILQKKRRGRQSYQPPLGDQPQNGVSRTQLGAKSSDHHRGVENDPSHVTSHRMSHCMGYFNQDTDESAARHRGAEKPAASPDWVVSSIIIATLLCI